MDPSAHSVRTRALVLLLVKIFYTPFMRSALAVLLLSPSLASVHAAAQGMKSGPVSGASIVSAVAGSALRAPLAIGVTARLAPSLSINAASTPQVLPSPSALNAGPAASPAAVIVEAARTAPASAPAAREMTAGAAAPAEALVVRGAMTAALTGQFRTDSKSIEASASDEARINVLFDGGTSRRAVDDAAPAVAGLPSLSAASALDKPVPAVSAGLNAAPPAAAKPVRYAPPFWVRVFGAVTLVHGLFPAMVGLMGIQMHQPSATKLLAAAGVLLGTGLLILLPSFFRPVDPAEKAPREGAFISFLSVAGAFWSSTVLAL